MLSLLILCHFGIFYFNNFNNGDCNVALLLKLCLYGHYVEEKWEEIETYNDPIEVEKEITQRSPSSTDISNPYLYNNP